MRFFNTAGPVNPEMHYCIDPLGRLDLPEVLMLIAQGKYFVLHAPRQTGKTTCLLALMKHLNEAGEYRALYANLEAAQTAREDVRRGMRAILTEIGERARDYLQDRLPLDRRTVLDEMGEDSALKGMLTEWAAASPKPLVLLLDEVDSLVGDTLISLLRQVRGGYDKRPAHFPHSIVLCGVRDLRDYRIHSSAEKAIITGGSAFNIKAKSLRLGDFDRDEVERLFAQHTAETGQVFEPAAMGAVWETSCGQPWVANALGYETCFEMREGRDRSLPITAGMVQQAKENLILRRETHLDQLADKLREERVRRVIGPILEGETNPESIPEDDIAYVADLGLIRTEGHLRIANAIYREVIPRQLTYSTQVTISHKPEWYILPNGRLDMHQLLLGFQQFFREHSEHWVERFDYKEAGPQLLLQAFLQRIINGGGRVEREYGLGRLRTDLLVAWPAGEGEVQRVVLELKILHGSLERTIAEGLPQTAAYMDRGGATEGHLVIFDRTPEKPWGERIFHRQETHGGHTIVVWGM